MNQGISGINSNENSLDHVYMEGIIYGDIISRRLEAGLQERKLDYSFWNDFQQKFRDLVALLGKPMLSMPGEHNGLATPSFEYDIFASVLSDADPEPTQVWKKSRILIKELRTYLGRISHLSKHTSGSPYPLVVGSIVSFRARAASTSGGRDGFPSVCPALFRRLTPRAAVRDRAAVRAGDLGAPKCRTRPDDIP